MSSSASFNRATHLARALGELSHGLPAAKDTVKDDAVDVVHVPHLAGNLACKSVYKAGRVTEANRESGPNVFVLCRPNRLKYMDFLLFETDVDLVAGFDNLVISACFEGRETSMRPMPPCKSPVLNISFADSTTAIKSYAHPTLKN